MKPYKIDREQKYKTNIVKMYQEGLSIQYIANNIYNRECRYRNLKRNYKISLKSLFSNKEYYEIVKLVEKTILEFNEQSNVIDKYLR